MHISTISVLPEIFDALHYGIPQRAVDKGLLHLKHWQLRDFTTDKHQSVDDRPYGGGPGMVMKVEPLRAAVQQAKAFHRGATKVVYRKVPGNLNNPPVRALGRSAV